MKTKNHPAKDVAFMGLLFAMAMVLSFLESMLPVLPMLPPGFKLGLSNIVTMYALFALGTRQGFTIAVLKSFFVLLTRMPTAAFMSLCGGLLSVLCMALLSNIKAIRKDYMLMSLFGALAHNVGQLGASVIIIGNSKVVYYLPVLIVAGILMGLTTGLVLRVVMPYISKLNRN